MSNETKNDHSFLDHLDSTELFLPTGLARGWGYCLCNFEIKVKLTDKDAGFWINGDEFKIYLRGATKENRFRALFKNIEEDEIEVCEEGPVYAKSPSFEESIVVYQSKRVASPDVSSKDNEKTWCGGRKESKIPTKSATSKAGDEHYEIQRMKFYREYISTKEGFDETYLYIGPEHTMFSCTIPATTFVDICQKVLDFQEEQLKDQKNPMEFEKASVHSLPFADKSFDNTVFHGILAILPESIQRSSLDEVARVTKKNVFISFEIVLAIVKERNSNPLGNFECGHFDVGFTIHFNFVKYLSDLGFKLIKEDCFWWLERIEKPDKNDNHVYYRLITTMQFQRTN